MTEKIDYINASIEILEKREELNYDELAVLCNLKKFVYQTQAIFKVGEYYSYKSMENVLHILKITAVRGVEVDFTFLNTESGKLVNMDNVKLDKRYIDPATAEQIAMFKRAEYFAKHGRKLDEFKQGDQVQNIDAGAYGVVDSLYDGDVVLQYHKKGPLYKSVPECLTLIKTAEELQEESK